MKFRSLTAAATIAAAFAFAGVASAATTVVYQSAPSLTSGVTTDAWCSACGPVSGGVEPLDQFTLTSAATITGLNLAVQDYDNGPTGDFTFEVYDSTHSNILFSQSITPTVLQGFNGDDSLVTGAVQGLHLGAGTYWAGFIGDGIAIPGFSGGNGSLIETLPHTGTQFDTLYSNTGYQLLAGGVPEPATWAMMLLGLGGLGAAMRMRRKTEGAFAAA